MANIFPIIAGLGAVYFLMSKKGGSGIGRGDPSDWSEDGLAGPGGSTPCHLLDGIWSPPHSSSSPIAAVTENPTLLALPLTLDAFSKADQYFLNNPSADASGDDVVHHVQVLLTEGLGCDWSKLANWTPRMKQLHNALITLYKTGQYSA